LATFVAPVENQFASEQFRQSSPKYERRLATLLLSGLTIFAFAVNGYHPYAEDGGLYLAGVKRFLDPSLYPHSIAFVLEPTRLSFFAPLVAAIVRLTHLSLPLTLLAFHVASIWATLFAAWMLSTRCWPSRTARTGAVVLLACWLALPVAGTALALMDPYLTARSISTPCTVLALAAVLDATDRSLTQARRRRGLILWITSVALAAAMHPLMAAYALGATMILACLRSPDSRVRIWGTAAISAASLAAAACIQLTAAPESADYRRIALTRSYWFPAAWSWYELAGLVAPLAILAIFAWRESRPPRRTPNAEITLAQMAVVAGATAWLAAALFAHAGASTHLIARLQPLRIFHIVYLVMVLLLGARLGELLLRRHAWRWTAAMLLLGGIMFASARSAFPASRHLELPWITPRNPWVQAFLWIRDNTPRDALFALDADYINSPGEDAQCFRAIAERSSLPDYSKDGGEASIAPELTAEWKAGQQAQQRLSATTTTDAMRFAELAPLGVTWLVLDTRATTNLDCPYANTAVKVCRLR
jgi:hypothetical protein